MNRRVALVALTAPLLVACIDSPPPPPGKEPRPEASPGTSPADQPSASPQPGASPKSSPAPKQRKVTDLPALLATSQPEGLFITDPWTGFTCTSPGAARLDQTGGGKGAHAWEAELRLERHEWSVRLRRDAAPPGASPRQRAETLVYARALAKPERVDAFRPGEAKRWGVDAAAAATYPVREGVWERALALVKGDKALVLWERAPSALGRALVTELGSRFHGSFAWGGAARHQKLQPSPYVDLDMNLRPAGETRAQQLAKGFSAAELDKAAALFAALAYSTSDPPDEALDPSARQLIVERVAQLPKGIGAALTSELQDNVVTYRDLRGLQLVLERAVDR
ncbi:MAG: hypothetical protein AB7N76_12765 [Planctomycetota bacterium]